MPKVIELLHKWVRDPDAVRWCAMLLELVHTWDDLVDQDKPVSREKIDEAFCIALLWMPSNPFYLRHMARLHAHLINLVRSWQVATDLERANTDPVDRPCAFILRSSYVDALVECAALLHGEAHARQMAIEIRRFCHAEGFYGYLDALRAELKES